MKAFIVGICYPTMTYDLDSSMQELVSLCEACHIEVERKWIQKVDVIQSSTLIGKGKVMEIKQQVDIVDMVIFDEELTPLQVKNLTDILAVEVTDRTDLILRIFESRAQTKEAKLQVSIAKNQYLLPRLAGMKEHLSHQQGGQGFRGSGEKQIELDRRVIHNQILQAKKELQKIVKQRQVQRKRRKANGIKVVALVGYTNSGKSTLLNTFCHDKQKQVMAKDMLFATLQTATRKVKIHGHACLLSDTVGFIDRLPHHLVQAFRSTLEEVKEADLLLHVIDSSNEKYDEYCKTTQEVLMNLGVEDIPVIYVYNKIDRNRYGLVQPREPYVFVSAKEQMNLDVLEDTVSRMLFKEYAIYDLNIPYECGKIYTQLQQETAILETQYLEDSIYVKVEAHPKDIKQYDMYRLKH